MTSGQWSLLGSGILLNTWAGERARAQKNAHLTSSHWLHTASTTTFVDLQNFFSLRSSSEADDASSTPPYRFGFDQCLQNVDPE